MVSDSVSTSVSELTSTSTNKQVSKEPIQIKRVAITGANGFIGKALVSAYHACGIAVNALLRNTTKYADDPFWSDINLIQGDLDDHKALKKLCTDTDLVIHCAAFMGKKDPKLSDQVNIEGTRHIIEVAHSAQVKRFIYVSSISVYRGTKSTSHIFDEALEPYLHPKLNHYSRSKLEGEHLCKSLCASLNPSSNPSSAQQHNMDYVIVRPTNVYGPGCRPWGSQVENLVSRYHICFGRVVFNFIHIDDLVQGFMLMGSKAEAKNQVFNLAAEAIELSLFHKHIAQRLGVWTWRLPWVLDTLIRYTIDGVATLRGEVRSTGYTPKFHYPHQHTQRLLGYEPQHLIYAKHK